MKDCSGNTFCRTLSLSKCGKKIATKSLARRLAGTPNKYTKSTVGNTVTYNYNSGSNKQDDGFNYDLIGNIMKILNRVSDCGINGSGLGDDALNRNFTYDSIYRLLAANGRESDTQSGNNYLYDDAPSPGSPNANHVRAYDRTYTYDKLGNIIDVIQGGITGFTRHYVYNTGKNTLQKVVDATSATIEDYTYDINGNQLASNLNRYYVWNDADQLICYKNQAGAIPTVFTQYDYSGQDRISKLVRTGTLASPVYERTIYIDGIFEYVKLENGSTYEKNYIRMMDDKSNIAEIRVNNGAAFPGDITDDVVYNLEDQIGSSTIRLDVNGTEIDKEEYYPFGDSSLRTFTYKRYRYVGKERDAESGLYYYGARYYAAWTCRFISVDPLAADYTHLTPYNYAGNKPIGDVDIDGMQGSGEQTSSGSQTSDNSAPKMEGYVLSEVEVTATRGGDKTWLNFIGSLDVEKMQNAYGQKKLDESLHSWYHKGRYGTDNVGMAAIPKEIQNNIVDAAKKEFLPALKEYWAQSKSDGSSYLYSYYKALTVTEKKEGQRVAMKVAVNVTAQWLMVVMPEIVELGIAKPVAPVTDPFKELITKMEFGKLQKLAGSYSKELNAFYKSDGAITPRISALKSYKELATRILTRTNGGDAVRLSPEMRVLHTKRLELINKTLNLIEP